MRLNTRMRYGIRAMFQLALHHQDGPVSLAQIAAAQQASVKYLEIHSAPLRASGLAYSQHGPRGVYTLARPPEGSTLREVFDILEGPEPYVPCTLSHTARHTWATCVTQEVWAKMYEALVQGLQSTALANLGRKQHCEGSSDHI